MWKADSLLSPPSLTSVTRPFIFRQFKRCYTHPLNLSYRSVIKCFRYVIYWKFETQNLLSQLGYFCGLPLGGIFQGKILDRLKTNFVAWLSGFLTQEPAIMKKFFLQPLLVSIRWQSKNNQLMNDTSSWVFLLDQTSPPSTSMCSPTWSSQRWSDQSFCWNLVTWTCNYILVTQMSLVLLCDLP